MWFWFVACAWATEGELWLAVDATADGDRIHLMLPASELRTQTEPALLRTGGSEIDLRDEARTLALGRHRTWTTDTGATVTLSREKPSREPATVFALGIGGPRGGGIEATFPLTADGADAVDDRVDAALDLTVESLGITLGDEACAQLRRSGPVLLVEIVGPHGQGFRVRTR